MSNEDKIKVLKARKNILESRGFWNTNIVKKIERRIRLLEDNKN